ncbi:DUF4397 domain-containing protein [Clostridium boliviensis]|uniref:DUF4397 domain-containing protein n=1 Tax=Clostridium boliviensis TaxID=318465 RepID=A0ABU4GG15_9CLOT|nr:DUF4397 domain-containing protein [Clostridium boliviensis]MDW2796553.1 DUF4397 domain-containing protein [Clostridium boliviensis]
MGIIYYMHGTNTDQNPDPDKEANKPAPDLREDWPLERNPGENSDTDEQWTSVITVFPKPIIPCYNCDTTENGLVRFLNAAAGYEPFQIYINKQLAVNGLDNGDMSQYGRVSAKMQTVTVEGQNGYVYLEKEIEVLRGQAITIAVINSDSGLEIMEIQDMYCNGGINTGCFRVCNLSITNRKVNVILNGGELTFKEVDYKELTGFKYQKIGFYLVAVMNGNAQSENILLTSNIYIRGNAAYTLYVFNWSDAMNAIRILIVEDRRN